MSNLSTKHLLNFLIFHTVWLFFTVYCRDYYGRGNVVPNCWKKPSEQTGQTETKNWADRAAHLQNATHLSSPFLAHFFFCTTQKFGEISYGDWGHLRVAQPANRNSHKKLVKNLNLRPYEIYCGVVRNFGELRSASATCAAPTTPKFRMANGATVTLSC